MIDLITHAIRRSVPYGLFGALSLCAACQFSTVVSPTGTTHVALGASQGCPDVTGHWVTGDGGGMSMDLTETDCKVFSEDFNSNAGFHHTVRGQWDPEQRIFSLNIARLDPHHCLTHLYSRVTVVEPSTFYLDTTSTEGLCGLPANYTGHLTFVRR